MGREPVSVDHFEYDAKGRLTSVVTTREPEFTERDRLLILAQRRADDVPRNRYGIPVSDATARENRFGFEVVGPTTDFAVELANKTQETFRKNYPEADMESLLWDVRLKT